MHETSDQHQFRVYKEAVARNSYESKIHKPEEGEQLASPRPIRYNWKATAPTYKAEDLWLPAHLIGGFTGTEFVPCQNDIKPKRERRKMRVRA